MVVPFTLTIHDQIGLIRKVMAGSQGVSFKSSCSTPTTGWRSS